MVVIKLTNSLKKSEKYEENRSVSEKRLNVPQSRLQRKQHVRRKRPFVIQAKKRR